MRFTVPLKEWLRGKGGPGSALLKGDGKRCCIGHVGQQCGVPDKRLLGKSKVHDIGDSRFLFPAWMREVRAEGYAICDIETAYTVNDDRDISDEQREAKLKEIFARHGDEIEFV